MNIIQYYERQQQGWPKPTWADDFVRRVQSGGDDRAATMFANMLHPEEQRSLPGPGIKTGAPPMASEDTPNGQ